MSKRNDDKKNKKMLNYMSLGISFGVLGGCIVSMIAGQNLGLCCSIGMCIGVFAGVVISLLK